MEEQAYVTRTGKAHMRVGVRGPPWLRKGRREGLVEEQEANVARMGKVRMRHRQHNEQWVRWYFHGCCRWQSEGGREGWTGGGTGGVCGAWARCA